MRRYFYKLYLQLIKLNLALRQWLFQRLFLNRRKAHMAQSDLSYLNLSGADLSGADLREAKLIHANLHQPPCSWRCSSHPWLLANGRSAPIAPGR